MKIEKILMDIRGVSNPKDFRILDEDIYNKLRNDKNCNFKDFCEFLNDYNIGPENIIYIEKNIFNNLYIYLKNGAYISNIVLDKEYFKMFNIKEAITYFKEEQLTNIKEKNYSSYFMLIPVQFKIFEFEKIYLSIPQEMVYEIWKDIYISCDYSFHNCNKDILKKILLDKKKSNKKYKNNKKIKVYRGTNILSTNVEKALSWTTDIKVAKMFARNKDMPVILTAYVYKNDIIDFINDRDESEVLVFYDDLHEIQIEK